MALSFPYPQMGTVKRPTGQGCQSCVHGSYCPALYWYKRFSDYILDEHLGVQCASWSNQEVDRIVEASEGDKEYNERLNDEGLLIEPSRNEDDDNGGQVGFI